MLVRDLQGNPETRVNKLNSYISERYGVSLRQKMPLPEIYGELASLMEQNMNIREQEAAVHLNETYNRNILLMEGMMLVVEEEEDRWLSDPRFQQVLLTLCEYVAECVSDTGKIPSADKVASIYKQTGDTKYSPIIIEKVFENFLSEVANNNASLSETTLNDVTHIMPSTNEVMYGHDVINAFFASRSAKLAEQYKDAMVSQFNSKLGNNNEK